MPDNSTVNSERATQNRVIKLLRDFCDYKYLGNLKDQDNMPYREEILKEYGTDDIVVIPDTLSNGAIVRYLDGTISNSEVLKLIFKGKISFSAGLASFID